MAGFAVARRGSCLGLAAALTLTLSLGSVAAASHAVASPAAAPARNLSLVPGSTFHPLGPTRIIDSRIPLNATALRSGTSQALQIAGKFGIPAGAVAVTGTLTIANPTSPGYVSLTPVSYSLNSNATSTLNFPTTDPRATGATEPLGSDGRMWALYYSGRTTDTAQIIFDLSGYFSTDAGGFTYGPVGPVRVADSQTSLGVAAPLTAGASESFQVAGQLGVAPDAVAIVGTLAISSPTAAGYVTLTPAERTSATASTSTSALNFTANDPRSTGLTVPLGGDGRLWAFYYSPQAGATVQFTLDVTGYFSPAAGGAKFHPLGLARIVDSRSGTGGATILQANRGEALAVAGMFGVPDGAVAVAGTLTVANETHVGSLSLTPIEATPATIGTTTSVFAMTDPRAAGVTEPLGPDGKMWVLYQSGRAGDTAQVIFDVTGYFAPDPGGLQPMPAYFANWMPYTALVRDANGVVLTQYASGLQYNPVSIADAALRFYDRWLTDSGDAAASAADQAAFFAQIHWLMANQSSDGRWFYRFQWGSMPLPWWSGMAQGLGISALLRAYSITGDAAYLPAIARARTVLERGVYSTGVQTTLVYGGRSYVLYQEYLPGGTLNVLNGWMFAVIGLYEAAVYLSDPMAAYDVNANDRGIGALRALLPLYNTGNWSYYSINSVYAHGSRASRAYHDTHIQELTFLSSVTGDRTLAVWANIFQSYVNACTKTTTCPAVIVVPDLNMMKP